MRFSSVQSQEAFSLFLTPLRFCRVAISKQMLDLRTRLVAMRRTWEMMGDSGATAQANALHADIFHTLTPLAASRTVRIVSRIEAEKEFCAGCATICRE